MGFGAIGSQRQQREAGFTIIEVLVVLTIVAVLVAIVIVSVINAFERAKQRATMADMRSIAKAVEIYITDTGHYPAAGQSMAQLGVILVPFQSSVLPTQDHWLHNYVYSSDNLTSYSIESYGKDGIDGAQIDYANRFSFNLDLIISNGAFSASPEP